MFILYPVLIALIVGVLTGGSLARIGQMRLTWAPLIALGMVVQLLLFSSPLGNVLGDAAPWVYVASNILVLAAVAANVATPGLWLVVLGGLSNFAAIVANGGYMPVDPDTLAAMGRLPKVDYSNSSARDVVALAPLTDIFALPAWVPFTNVFSVGDVLIGIGAAIAVLAAMHGRGPLIAPPAARVADEPA